MTASVLNIYDNHRYNYELSLFYWINKEVSQLTPDGWPDRSPIDTLVNSVEIAAELARYFSSDQTDNVSIVAFRDDFMDPHDVQFQEIAAERFISGLKKCFPNLAIDQKILAIKLKNGACSEMEEKIILQSALLINQIADEANQGRKIGIMKKSHSMKSETKLFHPKKLQKIFDTFKNYDGPVIANKTSLGISKINFN